MATVKTLPGAGEGIGTEDAEGIVIARGEVAIGPQQHAMNVAIEIPESVSAPLRSRWQDVPRRVLEAVAAEAYRSDALTAFQVGELLGHGSRWETESFLKRVQAYLHYTEDDLERDLAALRAARG